MMNTDIKPIIAGSFVSGEGNLDCLETKKRRLKHS
jgi:hypothetical protein